METDPQPRWYTIQGVCDHYQISRPTLYKWIEAGMPCHQPAGPRTGRLFDLEEIDEWIRSSAASALPSRSSLRDRQVEARETVRYRR